MEYELNDSCKDQINKSKHDSFLLVKFNLRRIAYKDETRRKHLLSGRKFSSKISKTFLPLSSNKFSLRE